MKISLRTAVLSAVIALGAALPAAAQDLSLGYQFQRLYFGGNDVEGLSMPLGFNVDASFPLQKGDGKLSAIGQFDWSHKSYDNSDSSNISSFGGGVRWATMKNPKYTPYVQGLIGASHLSEGDFGQTELMFQLGGGVAGHLNAKWDWLGQIDYRRIASASGDDDPGTNSFRFIVGVRTKWKK